MPPFFNFGKKSDEEVRRERLQKETVEELQRGGIPVQARERIERERAMGKNFFTSAFTAREFLLTKQAGLETIGQVMGTSFFNISYLGMSRTRWRSTGELTDLSRAQLSARKLAISRMQQEAKLLGASGVIGVRIQTGHHEWSSRMVEFTAVGTAVRIPGWKGEEPFTSALSAQEFWLLHNAGYAPVGIALGVCSYYMYTDANTQGILYSWFGGNNANNQEIPLYTRGFQTARNEATNRLTQDLYEHKADGVVAMEVNYDIENVEYEINDRTYHDLIAHFVAMGTAVNVVRDSKMVLPSPQICVNLAAGRLREIPVARFSSAESSAYEEDLLGDDD